MTVPDEVVERMKQVRDRIAAVIEQSLREHSLLEDDMPWISGTPRFHGNLCAWRVLEALTDEDWAAIKRERSDENAD
jgi:hypothetical protein